MNGSGCSRVRNAFSREIQSPAKEFAERGEVSSESIFRDLPRQMFPSSIDQRSMRVFENRLGSSTRGPPDIFSRIKIVLQSRLKRIEEGRAREKKEEEEGNGWKGEKSSSW